MEEHFYMHIVRFTSFGEHNSQMWKPLALSDILDISSQITIY